MNYKYKTQPWEHQVKALDYLYHNAPAALYTDMGTGKTKVMIDLIVNKGYRTVLVVCTNKGCEVWEKQIQIHSNIRTENILNLAGMSTSRKTSLLKERLSLETQDDPLIVIVNYEGVWRPGFGELLESRKVPLDCIICDESHRIKAPGSKCSRFLARLTKKTQNRFLLTGTPMAEAPTDIYAQYRFLDPQIFGTSFARFKERYLNIDPVKSMKIGYPILDAKQPYKNLDELHDKMFSIAFRMPSSVKLPKRKNIIRHYKLSSRASRLYRRLCDDKGLILPQGVVESQNPLTLLLYKRQFTSGNLLVTDDFGDQNIVQTDTGRIEVLAELLEGLPKDEPVVVFAQFRADFDAIRSLCKKIGRGYSEVSGVENTELDWQRGKTSVIAVQYESGSESIDLTRACYCIYYTMTNRLALYLQSKKRTHRPGQTRMCVYYYIAADLSDGSGTIDRQIISAVQAKEEIIGYIMEHENTPED